MIESSGNVTSLHPPFIYFHIIFIFIRAQIEIKMERDLTFKCSVIFHALERLAHLPSLFLFYSNLLQVLLLLLRSHEKLINTTDHTFSIFSLFLRPVSFIISLYFAVCTEKIDPSRGQSSGKRRSRGAQTGGKTESGINPCFFEFF